MKLKHTLFMLLLFFSLVPLYVFGFFMIYQNNNKIESIMKADLAVISKTQILDIKNFCEARKEQLGTTVQYAIVRDAMLKSLGEKEITVGNKYLNNLLYEQKVQRSFIESVSLVNKNFVVVASSEEYDENTLSKLKDTATEKLSGDFFIGNMYERETPNGVVRVVPVCQGVFSEGDLIGYVVEEIKTSYFDQYRLDTNLWKEGTVYIIDGTGALISAGAPEEENRDEYVTNEKDRENYTTAWEKVDKDKNPYGEFSYNIGGDEYITYYSDINYTDWSIRVTVNLSSFTESRKAYRYLLIITAVIVTILMVIINYYLTRRLTNPIDNIADVLKKVQKDQNYTLRIENLEKGELGFLAKKVNELLSYIERENIQEKERQRYLAKKAERDSLTGLRNKRAIEEKIQDMVERALETDECIGVGFLDIDDFKDYNTRYGHLEGDNVLRFVAGILKENICGEVGRNGGDEFAFCIQPVKDIESLEIIAEKILEKVNEGIFCKAEEDYIAVSCSIGIAAEKGNKLNSNFLLKKADEAMYIAKGNGKNSYKIVYEDNTCSNSDDK